MTNDGNWMDFQRTGPGTLGGQYLRTFWQPVYRAEDLVPGSAAQIQIMSEYLTLYRGTDGQAHLLAQRCAHRGMQLSAGWVEADGIRCFYHGWKYDGSGQCIEQPGEDETFASRIRIPSYPTREYLGLIFAYLGEGEPPPLPRHQEFEDPGVLDVYPPEYWPCNFFNRIDNACDLAHLSFAHRESRVATNTLQLVPTRVTADETEYGVVTYATRTDSPTQVLHFHMPNINQFFAGGGSNRGSSRSDSEAVGSLRDGSHRSGPGERMGRLLFRVPVDDEHCVSFPIDHVTILGDAGQEYLARRRRLEAAQLAAPESPEQMAEGLLARKLTTADVRERDPANLKTLTSVEDYAAQVGQGAMANHAAEHLGRMDVGLILIRQLWQREMQALAEGRPLKQWSRTERVMEELPAGGES